MTTFVDRLLDRFEPKQRHLAFLVGLLVLTFVLTVVLAFRAHRSEIARQQQADAVRHDFAAKAAQEWLRYLVEGGNDALKWTFVGPGRILLSEPAAPLSSLAGTFALADFCQDCLPLQPATVFSIDGVNGAVESIGPDAVPASMVAAVLGARARDSSRRLAESLELDLVLFRDGDRVAGAATLFRLDDDGRLIRAVGYLVPAELLQRFLAVAFDAPPVVPEPLARGAANSTLFTIRVEAGDLTLVDTSPNARFAARADIEHGVLQGAALYVGFQDAAAALFMADAGITSGVPLLLALLFTICGLIILALLLVRREAELVRLRADFISGVSHELRTPLAQIRMFTETLLLNRVRSDVERRRSLEIIDQEARRLTHLVENVLLFSKSEGGRRPRLAPEPTDLATEVRRAAESFGPMCRVRDATLRTELQDGIIAAVDRGALRQIMINLVDNALKYGPSGQRVTIGVALFDDSAQVWVDDQGPGIPLPERDRVFESFYRLPRDVESRLSGSGIGLAVVRELTRLHGGDAWAAAAPGGGARIVAQFPDAYLRTEPAAELATAS